jgi:hypothetical protein
VADKELTLILKARNLASREVDKLGNSLDRVQKSRGFRSVIQGVGVGVGIGAFNLLAGAIGGVTTVLGDAIEGAIQEEESIAKLSTSLRANVKDWDGNTAAIEAMLTARMKLGFSDDEQRDSLARIVVATNDVSRALDIQRTAMDLARLKGIDLATASDALIKIEGGQFRALKALGIELPKNATQTQALAAVQKAAQGQAESYAGTTRGKLLVAQVKVGEAMEKLGTAILPVVAEAMGIVADAVAWLSGVIGNLIGWVKSAIKWLGDLAAEAGKLLPKLPEGVAGGKGGFTHVPHTASGGWVGLNGPEIRMLGEKGPEYVVPNHQLGKGGGTQTIYLVIDGKTVAGAIVPAVSRQMYYEMQQAAPTLART